MKVKVEAVSPKNKSFKTHKGEWYRYENINEVDKGKWYDIELNGKTVTSLKPSSFTKSVSTSTQNTTSSGVLLTDEQFESIKKYLEKKLYLNVKHTAFDMAKVVVDKYYQDKTEAEYIAALEEYIDYFSKLLIHEADGK